MRPADTILLAGAGLGAGIVNGIAGGGSLVSYPALLATGHSALVANVTNTVGIFAGYVGGAAGYRREIVNQRRRVRELSPIALLGGLTGAILLLTTPEAVFEWAAPVLVAVACLLFATQPLLKKWIARRRADTAHLHERLSTAAKVAVFLASVYGGYFGAGLGVIYLAVLGTVLIDPLPGVNSLRGVLSLVVNLLAVLLFGVAADVHWAAAGVLAISSLFGGLIGARTALKLTPVVLRTVVLVFGVIAFARLVTS
jgi:uncharacterized membrane protein YfcA